MQGRDNIRNMQSRKPQLTEFLAGYAGPPPIEYRGGNIKVIAAIVYADGIVIEWFVGPMPDLSGMPDVEQSRGEQSSSVFEQFRDRPGAMERMRRFKKLSTFWESATLTDDLGTQYRRTEGDAGGAEDVGYKGREAFSPPPPVEARTLTVRIYELAITVALK
jgi:hypothetical protein